nr:formin-like protein 3 [Aegilops tauschii subsp. strangulata]
MDRGNEPSRPPSPSSAPSPGSGTARRCPSPAPPRLHPPPRHHLAGAAPTPPLIGASSSPDRPVPPPLLRPAPPDVLPDLLPAALPHASPPPLPVNARESPFRSSSHPRGRRAPCAHTRVGRTHHRSCAPWLLRPRFHKPTVRRAATATHDQLLLRPIGARSRARLAAAPAWPARPTAVATSRRALPRHHLPSPALAAAPAPAAPRMLMCEHGPRPWPMPLTTGHPGKEPPPDVLPDLLPAALHRASPPPLPVNGRESPFRSSSPPRGRRASCAHTRAGRTHHRSCAPWLLRPRFHKPTVRRAATATLDQLLLLLRPIGAHSRGPSLRLPPGLLARPPWPRPGAPCRATTSPRRRSLLRLHPQLLGCSCASTGLTLGLCL